MFTLRSQPAASDPKKRIEPIDGSTDLCKDLHRPVEAREKVRRGARGAHEAGDARRDSERCQKRGVAEVRQDPRRGPSEQRRRVAELVPGIVRKTDAREREVGEARRPYIRVPAHGAAIRETKPRETGTRRRSTTACAMACELLAHGRLRSDDARRAPRPPGQADGRPPRRRFVGQRRWLQTRADARETSARERDAPIHVPAARASRRRQPTSARRGVCLDDVVVWLRGGRVDGALPVFGRAPSAQRHPVGVASEHGLDHPVLRPGFRALEPPGIGGESRRWHMVADEARIGRRKPVVGRERPREREQALRLNGHGARVVEPEEPARAGESPEVAHRGQLVEKLRRVLSKHDIDGLAVGERVSAIDDEVLRTHDCPAPPEAVDLAAVEICEPELLAMRRVDENPDARTDRARPRLRVRAPRRDERLPKRGPGSVIGVRVPRREGRAGPDLPLARGLVAVVLEHAEPAVRALEDVEAAPEEGLRQRTGGEELLREWKLGRAPLAEARARFVRLPSEPPEEAIESDREGDKSARPFGLDRQRGADRDLALGGAARERPGDEKLVGDSIRQRH